MGFCVKCGAKVPDGGAFCPSCGTAQQAQGVAAQAKTSHKELATILVLLGGILGILFAVASLVVVPFFGGMMGYGFGMMGRYGRYGFNMMGYPEFSTFFTGMMMAWTGVGLVGAVLAIYSGYRMRQDYSKSTATIGIIGGVLMLITFSWFPGLIALAGAILAYVE